MEEEIANSSRSHIVEKYWTLCEINQEQSTWAQGSNSAANAMQQKQLNSPQAHDEGATAVPPRISTLAMAGAASYQFPLPPPSLTPQTERDEMAVEREKIIRDLLLVLTSISQVNMEPNGGSLVSPYSTCRACAMSI